MVKYADGPQTEAEIFIDAAPDAVWPELEGEIVASRLAELRTNMVLTLEGYKTLAERSGS